MIPESATPEARRYTTQYELLRAQVLGTGCDAGRAAAVEQRRGVGLAIMLREGMPGWLNAVEAVIRPLLASNNGVAEHASAVQSAVGEYGSAPTWLSGVRRQDLAALLASLVLSTRRVEGSSPAEGGMPCR